MNRRLLLPLSLAANTALVGVVALLLARKPVPSPSPTDPPTAAQPATAIASLSASPSEASSPQFRWSQVESADYPIYIANLRRIGCPEQTIRDIITADVDTLYAPKRRQLDEREMQLGADASQLRPASHQAIETARRQLRDEESALLARLFGEKPTDQPTSVVTQAGSSPAQTRKPRMPAAFAATDTNDLNLTPAQQAALNGIRRRFLDDLGATNLDPNSPEYAEHWNQAQPKADQSVKALLGYQAYLQLTRKTSRPAPAPSSQP